MTTIDHLLKLRQARQDAEDTLKARYSFEARIAYDNAARAFEYALSVAAEDLLKMVEAGQSHAAGLLAALEATERAINEYYRYMTGGETRGSYDGKPERQGLWDAQRIARAAIAAAKGEQP